MNRTCPCPCEVWAEQGHCPHTHPDIGARMETQVAEIGFAIDDVRTALATIQRPLMIPALVASKS